MKISGYHFIYWDKVIEDLPFGTYYLVEASAPTCYILAYYEYIKIHVDDGHVIYQAWKIGGPKTIKTEHNEQEVYLL